MSNGRQPLRIRVFVDFWNFRLHFLARIKDKEPDWQTFPGQTHGIAHRAANSLALGTPTALDEVRVYAGFVPQTDDALLEALTKERDRMGGFRVFAVPRKREPAPIKCHHCKQEFKNCSGCKRPLTHVPEKGIDALIVTDMLSLAWEGAYDVAALVSTDLDFIPAVSKLHDRGLRVINCTWKDEATKLADACWGRAYFDDILKNLGK